MFHLLQWLFEPWPGSSPALLGDGNTPAAMSIQDKREAMRGVTLEEEVTTITKRRLIL